MNEAGGVGGIRTIEEGGLLHGAAHFTHANNFKGVGHTTAKFTFDIGATGSEYASYPENDKKGQGLTHSS
jgi:hypothetical protein